MKQKKYNAVIIGAGSIGAMKPDKYDSPTSRDVLTIAHAMYNNKRIEFDIWDKDIIKQTEAQNKWFRNIHRVPARQKEEPQFDIIAVCTPTETHYNIIKESIKHAKPKLILAEKPFCSNKKEASEIVRLCAKNNIHLIIDYIRRFDSSAYIIKHELDNCEQIYWTTVTYNRGFVHEACHAIDLMNFWFGECSIVSVPVKNKIIDRDKNDPAAHIICEHNKVPVFYMPVDGREFSIFEITIMTNRGKIVLADHGKTALFYNRIPEPTYGNYETLNSKPIITKTELTVALQNMMDHIIMTLDTGTVPDWICSGKEALMVHDVIDMYNKARGK